MISLNENNFSKRTRGKIAEEIAARYLEKQGLKLKEQNYNCKSGEIDLVMEDGAMLVFVEVRYRETDDYGDSLTSVTRSKQRKIIRAAKFYLLQHDLFEKISCRFDVVSSSLSENPSEILWIKNAFWVKY